MSWAEEKGTDPRARGGGRRRPRRQPVHGPARAAPARRGPGAPRWRRCARSCRWSRPGRRRGPAQSPRPSGQVLAQRRSLRRAQTRTTARGLAEPVGPPGGSLGWRVPDTEPARPRPACCCSTATRWPTGRSSRCRWRTSRPHGAADQRGLRLHLDAHQRAARRAADPHRRSRSTCPARPSGSRSTPSTRPTGPSRPTSSRARSRWSRRCWTRCGSRPSRWTGYEADDIIATLATQAVGRGLRGADLHRRPRRVPAGQRRCTVLYPMRGVSELARMTPDGGRGEVRRPAAPLPRARRAGGGDLRQPARACPGVGPKTAAKWINQYDGLDNVIAHADEIKGKAGDSLREHLGDVIRNRQLNALVRDLDLAARPTDLADAALGPRGGAHSSSTAWSSGCCATGCSRRWSPRRRSRRSASSSTAPALGAGRGRGLARRARAAGERVGRPGAGQLARRHR